MLGARAGAVAGEGWAMDLWETMGVPGVELKVGSRMLLNDYESRSRTAFVGRVRAG